jgi:glutaconate CoA-transferase subunit B
MHTGIIDVFLYSQRGFFDFGFIGAAQIDHFGNVNTSVIGSMEAPRVRLSGGGGANDIVSSCREVLVLTKHERRRFVETVDFVTSPGYLRGGDSRERAGLILGRPTRVVTDLALMGFDPVSKRMRLDALQPDVTVEEVVESTGFELLMSGPVGKLHVPTDRELEMLRTLETGISSTSDRVPEKVVSV